MVRLRTFKVQQVKATLPELSDLPVDASDKVRNLVKVDRRESPVDRRTGLDKRQKSREQAGYTGEERRAKERREDTGLERRRGPGRRLADDRRSAEEGEMTSEQFEFVMAVETYKKVNKRMYPTWTEVLEVIQHLGYRKVAHRNIELPNVPEPALSKSS
jgi:hypothetical protein